MMTDNDIEKKALDLARLIDDCFAQGWKGVAQRTSFIQIKLRSALLEARASEPPRAPAGPGTAPHLLRTTVVVGSVEDRLLEAARGLVSKDIEEQVSAWLFLASFIYVTSEPSFLCENSRNEIYVARNAFAETVRHVFGPLQGKKDRKASDNRGAAPMGAEKVVLAKYRGDQRNETVTSLESQRNDARDVEGAPRSHPVPVPALDVPERYVRELALLIATKTSSRYRVKSTAEAISWWRKGPEEHVFTQYINGGSLGRAIMNTVERAYPELFNPAELFDPDFAEVDGKSDHPDGEALDAANNREATEKGYGYEAPNLEARARELMERILANWQVDRVDWRSKPFEELYHGRLLIYSSKFKSDPLEINIGHTDDDPPDELLYSNIELALEWAGVERIPQGGPQR